MKYAGQKDPNTYNNHYQPNNSGTDGQASYFGLDVRDITNDLFRGLTLARNPQLRQTLPAEKQEEFESSAEVVAMEKELEGLRGRKDKESISLRGKLYAKKRKLVEKEVRKCQIAQTNRPGRKDTSSPCYHRSIFDRVRFLMPERDRLAASLFETAALRSPVGLSALRDMVALCEQDAEVEFRPGLEPWRCHCSNPVRHRKLAQSLSSRTDTQSIYDWRHIYSCYKRSHNGFVELCFLCNEWISEQETWSDHCQGHLERPETLPIQCDPLVHGGVLACAGYCLFCMADPSLLPEERLQQFPDRGPWKEHVNRHYEKYVENILDDRKAVKCPHIGMRCISEFESANYLKFHLLDVHCPDFLKQPQPLEISESDCDMGSTRPKLPKRSKTKEPNAENEIRGNYYFINETAKTVSKNRPATPPITPSSPSVSLSSIFDLEATGVQLSQKTTLSTKTPQPCVSEDTLGGQEEQVGQEPTSSNEPAVTSSEPFPYSPVKEQFTVDRLIDEWRGWFYVKWLDGSCSWEPRKNVLDKALIEDLRRDYKGLSSGVEVVRTRQTKGRKMDYRVRFKGRDEREDIWVAERFLSVELRQLRSSS